MPKKVDRNQAEITRALRQAGATVQPLHEIGHGCVDLLVGFRGVNVLLEIKDWMQPPSRQKLTPDEKEWHENWRGQVAVVKTATEALQVIGAIK
jgi:hypothetical protein